MPKPIPDHPSGLAGKQAQSLTTQTILLTSFWAGLVTGILEVLVQGARMTVFHEIIGLDLEFIWMAPLADALIFLAVGLLYLPYARRFARANNLHVLVFILAFLGAYSAIQFAPIHWIARDILTLGTAVSCANAIQNFGQPFLRLVRRTTPALLVAVALAGVGLHLYRGVTEARALKSLPAADPGLPNVLLIVMDTVRAENLSLYGYERDTTPVLRELAKDGVVFQQAFSTAPWTLPSHASFFTGRWPHELSADWRTALDRTFPTLAETLREQGYATAAFVGNNSYVTFEYGLNRGFLHFEDYDLSLGRFYTSSAIGRATGCWRTLFSRCIIRKLTGYYEILGRKSAQEVNRETMSWVTSHKQKPYFIFINYFDAHWPFLPPEPFDATFNPQRPRFSKVFVGYGTWDGTPEETQNELIAYDESIRYVDYELGTLLDQMHSQGLLDNTLIIITSDHGEEFQEHRVMSHGNSLYRQSVQVPLVMIFPERLHAGMNVEEPVSLRNVPATVLEIIGRSANSPFPGQSLTNFLSGSANPPDPNNELLLSEVTYGEYRPGYYPISHGDMKAIGFDGLRYILNGDGTEELYDFILDPQETNDLTGTPQGQTVLPQFRTLLQDVLAQSNPSLQSTR